MYNFLKPSITHHDWLVMTPSSKVMLRFYLYTVANLKRSINLFSWPIKFVLTIIILIFVYHYCYTGSTNPKT